MDQGSSLNFDFNSQAGVMSLLASIRSSNLSPADKNELRDLVFLYTNGGGDVSVRIALEQKLIAHKIQPAISSAVSSTPTPVAPILPFGSSRPAPIFKAVPNVPLPTQSASAPIPQPATVYVAATPLPTAPPAIVPQMTPAPQVVIEPVVVPTQQPVAVPTPVATPASQPVVTFVPPTPQPQPQPVVAPVAPVIAASIPVVSQPVVAAPLPAQPAPAPVNSVVATNHLDRIREIKAAVNSKVGNPVNLVDINNEVGREYMNALLEAMKRLSGGAAGQIDVAMQRLETAYQAVEVAVAAHNQAGAVVTPPPVSPLPPTPAVEPVSVPVNPVVQPVASPQPEVVIPPQSPAPQTSQTVPLSAIPIPPEIVPPEEANISGFAATNETVVESGFNTPGVPTPPPVPAFSLASEPNLHTPQDLPSASSLSTSASGDPLKTKEIDDGLDQLLSDWSLFKKSGLFGTGPRGREHPLFKKLCALQIPLVLAGRFEGSTQDIKQSITDYMNGWRYEQGIIYEQGETFEHYLRRVIKQILDLQKKRKPA